MLLLFILVSFLAPSIYFIVGYWKHNFSQKYIDSGLEYTGELDGFESLPQLEFDTAPTCSEFIYLGSENIYMDCSKKCNSERYEYKYIDKQQDVVIDNRRLYGAYCMIKAIAQCNLNTSQALVGPDGYKCVTKYPNIFGGVTGNTIVGCNGILNDHLLGHTYEYTIPSKLNMSDINEKLPNGKYRFTCKDDLIPYPPELGTRFDVDANVCNALDPLGKFENYKCECTRYVNQDTGSICSSCRDGWAKSNGLPGESYAPTIGRDCINPFQSSHLDRFIQFACGPSTIAQNKTCEHALVNVTNTYMPHTLEKILG